MAKPNIPLESIPKGITRSQAKQDSQLAKIVDLNQKGSLKRKPLRNREYLSDNKRQNIPDPTPTEQELDNTLKLDDSSLEKAQINNQSISSENSEKTSGFHSSFCPDLSIVTSGSSNQDKNLTNESSYFDETNLLTSTVIIFRSTYATIEELIEKIIEKLKRIYAPVKSVYQLQGELGNTFMWE